MTPLFDEFYYIDDIYMYIREMIIMRYVYIREMIIMRYIYIREMTHLYHMHESGYTFTLDVFYEAYLYLYVATHAECLRLRTFYFKHIAYFFGMRV